MGFFKDLVKGIGNVAGGGLIDLAGKAIGGIINSGAQDKSNKANMELAKYQFDRNVDMWKMQNMYNTPVAQMNRLRAAGLNPNLVYGNGSVSGNTTSNAPEFNAPELKKYTGWRFDNIMQAAAQQAQIRNMSADTSLKKATEDYQNMQSMKSKAETKNIEMQTLLSQKDMLLKDLQAAQQRLQYEYDRNANPSRLAMLEAQVRNEQQRFDEINARIDNLNSSTSLNEANVDLTRSRVEEVFAHISLMSAQQREAFARSVGQDLQNQINQVLGFDMEASKLRMLNASIEKAFRDADYTELRTAFERAGITGNGVDRLINGILTSGTVMFTGLRNQFGF